MDIIRNRSEYLSNLPFKLIRAGLIVIALCLLIFSAPVITSDFDQVDPVTRTTTVPVEYTGANGETEYATFDIQTSTSTTGEVVNGTVHIGMQAGWGNPYETYNDLEDLPKVPLDVAIIAAPASWSPDRVRKDGTVLLRNSSVYSLGEYVSFERALNMPASIEPEGIGPTEATLYYYAEWNSGTTRLEQLRTYTIYRPSGQRPRSKALLAAVVILITIIPTYHPSVQSRLTEPLSRYADRQLKQPIYSKFHMLNIYFKSEYSSKTPTYTTTTSTDTESNSTSELSTEDATVDVNQIRDQATDTRTQGEQAEANGQYQQAVDAYYEAISQFEQAIAVADDETKEEFQAEVAETQTSLKRVKHIHDQRDSVATILQAAERNFKEAIARYVADEKTVARIRFRQARDTFKEAQRTIEESDTELLIQSIAVSFEEEATLQSQAIEESAVLGESTIKMLAAVDIESARDLKADADEIRPPVVSEFEESDEVSNQETALLTILSWWYEGDSREFGSEAELSQRYEQADYGFNQST
jgi:tetratricopeptide (TPR) repeat protein